MKVHITLDILPEEVGLATELLATLRLIAAQIGGPQAAVPQVKAPKDLLKALVAKLGVEPDDSKLASSIVGVLDSYENRAQGIADFVEAFELEVFDTRHVAAGDPMAPYFSILANKLPEQYNKEIRKSIISKVLTHMTRKRPVDINRVDFILQAEAFACLVKLECVQAEGAVQTIEKLVSKPDTRAAAITMLGKTLDLCPEKVASVKPLYLNKLWAALDTVTEPSFQYDLSFILTCRQQIVGQMPAAPPVSLLPQAPLQAPLPAPPPAAAAPPPPCALADQPIRGFYANTVLQGHSEVVFCLAWDPVTRLAFSGGKESNVFVWDAAGKKQHTLALPAGYCTAAIDCHRHGNFVGLSGMASDTQKANVPPMMGFYDGGPHGWKSRAIVPRPNAQLISTIRFMLGDGDTFVSSETDHLGANSICYWDLGRAASSEPVHVYREHEHLTATVTTTAAHPTLVVTGAQDGGMLVFDVRAPRSVGALGIQDPVSGEVRGHSQAITSVDAMGDIVLSTGLDAHVNVWDLKMMASSAAGGARPTLGPLASIRVEAPPTGDAPETPIYKLAYANSPRPTLAAFASANSLNLLDWSSGLGSPQLIPCANFTNPSIAGQQYHELKWAPGAAIGDAVGATLLAASEIPVVAAFSVV